MCATKNFYWHPTDRTILHRWILKCRKHRFHALQNTELKMWIFMQEGGIPSPLTLLLYLSPNPFLHPFSHFLSLSFFFAGGGGAPPSVNNTFCAPYTLSQAQTWRCNPSCFALGGVLLCQQGSSGAESLHLFTHCYHHHCTGANFYSMHILKQHFVFRGFTSSQLY